MNRDQPCPASSRRLAAQERWLFERVTGTAPALGMLAGAASSDDAHWVREGRLPAAQRLEVYRRGYFARLVECLADDYPAVAHALGPLDFEALCLDFIEHHPPRSSSLNFYGAPFAAFCATWPAPFAAWASELARLEWAIVEAIHADADAVLDATRLGALSQADWARARLLPSPALRVLRSAYPVHRYYRSFLDDETPTPPPFEPSIIAVCRRSDDVWRIGIPAPFADLLSHLVNGVPLATALEAIQGRDPTSSDAGAADLQRAFSEWVACGFFEAVRLD